MSPRYQVYTYNLPVEITFAAHHSDEAYDIIAKVVRVLQNLDIDHSGIGEIEIAPITIPTGAEYIEEF